MSIHKDHIGFVLGKGRSTVSRIGRDTNTRIEVVGNGGGLLPASGAKQSPPPPNFVDLVVGGRSVEDVRRAQVRLLDIARAAEQKMPRVADLPPQSSLEIVDVKGVEVRVMIGRDDVGMVLGSKGRTLRKLTSDTWTWSKVFKGVHESEFSIRGYTRQDVEECLKRLLSIAQESYRRRTTGRGHVKSGTISALSMVGEFKLAPVPPSRKRGSTVPSAVLPGSYGSPPPCPAPPRVEGTLPHPSSFPTPSWRPIQEKGASPVSDVSRSPSYLISTPPHSGPLYSDWAESPTYSPESPTYAPTSPKNV